MLLEWIKGKRKQCLTEILNVKKSLHLKIHFQVYFVKELSI